MANLTLRYLDELSYVLNSRRHLATQGKASSVGDLLNADEDRFSPNSNITYVSTGILSVQWDVISLRSVPGVGPSSTSVLGGAEAVLRQYSKARARLAAATRDLPGAGN